MFSSSSFCKIEACCLSLVLSLLEAKNYTGAFEHEPKLDSSLISSLLWFRSSCSSKCYRQVLIWQIGLEHFRSSAPGFESLARRNSQLHWGNERLINRRQDDLNQSLSGSKTPFVTICLNFLKVLSNSQKVPNTSVRSNVCCWSLCAFVSDV